MSLEFADRVLLEVLRDTRAYLTGSFGRSCVRKDAVLSQIVSLLGLSSRA